jgi:hypothetical protein
MDERIFKKELSLFQKGHGVFKKTLVLFKERPCLFGGA